MKPVPKHKGRFLIGDIPDFLQDILYYPAQIRQKMGPVFSMDIPTYRPVFLFKAEAIRQVLDKQHLKFKKSSDYDALRLILGRGLLTNEGDSWKTMRKELQPFFYDNVIETFIAIMTHHSDALVKKWLTLSTRLLNQDMKQITLSIASEAFFGLKMSDFDLNIPKIVDELNELTIKKARLPYNKIPFSLPFPLHIKMKKMINQINHQIYQVINNAQDDKSNLLTMILHHPKISPQQARDEILTFLTAGYETTANTLMYFFWALGHHPKIQADIIDEVSLTPLNPQDYKSWKQQFPLLVAAIQETLRLYPPAWIIGRQSIDDTEIDGYQIPANTNVLVDLYLWHRDPDYWRNPETFDPNRFLTRVPDKWHYLPFGAGPRICIGQQFAMMEIICIAHHVFRQCRVKALTERISLLPLVTLTPSHPIEISIEGVL